MGPVESVGVAVLCNTAEKFLYNHGPVDWRIIINSRGARRRELQAGAYSIDPLVSIFPYRILSPRAIMKSSIVLSLPSPVDSLNQPMWSAMRWLFYNYVGGRMGIWKVRRVRGVSV